MEDDMMLLWMLPLLCTIFILKTVNSSMYMLNVHLIELCKIKGHKALVIWVTPAKRMELDAIRNLKQTNETTKTYVIYTDFGSFCIDEAALFSSSSFHQMRYAANFLNPRNHFTNWSNNLNDCLNDLLKIHCCHFFHGIKWLNMCSHSFIHIQSSTLTFFFLVSIYFSFSLSHWNEFTVQLKSVHPKIFKVAV